MKTHRVHALKYSIIENRIRLFYPVLCLDIRSELHPKSQQAIIDKLNES